MRSPKGDSSVGAGSGNGLDSAAGEVDRRRIVHAGKIGRRERTCTAICGMVRVVQGDECLASFLAIGEPRGAGAGAGAAALGVVCSLEGAGLEGCADLWPRPLVGGRRPRSEFDSQLTIMGWVKSGVLV